MAKKKSKAKRAPARSKSKSGSPPAVEHVNDLDSIKQIATTVKLRRAALAWCLANAWPTQDIDTLERVDANDWHGWSMWER